MSDSVLLLGGTDVTLAVAEAVLATGARLRAIVTVGEKFSISYSATEVNNARNIDLAGWGAQHGVYVLPYRSYDDLLAWLDGDMSNICLVAGW
jgi:methionyl-tRNA formyltransferase